MRNSNVLDQLIHQTVQSWPTSLCSVYWDRILRVQVSRQNSFLNEECCCGPWQSYNHKIEINKINGRCFLIYFFAKSCFSFFPMSWWLSQTFVWITQKYFLLVGTKLIRAALQYLFNLVNRSTNIGGKYITHTCTCHYVRISFIETTYPAPSHVCFSP